MITRVWTFYLSYTLVPPRVFTICHLKLTQNTALEQKRLELRSLSSALPNLWLLLVTCISQWFLPVNPFTAYVEARFGTTCDITSFSTQKWRWSTPCESFRACANGSPLWAVELTRHNYSRYFTQYPPPPPQLRSLCQSSHNKVASSGLFCSKASKLVASLRARSSFRVASEARCKRTCEQTITAIRVPRSYVTVCVPFSRGSTVPPSEEIPQASTVLLILLQDSYSVSIVHGFSAIECLALHRVPRHLLFTWIQMLTTETTPSCIQCCL